MAATAGHSGTPLPKKLGMVSGERIAILNAPPGYVRSLSIAVIDHLEPQLAVLQFFTKSRKELANALPKLRARIAKDGAIWISWPKKSAKVPTDLDENVVRELALAHQLVDIKVCAVDEIWSGLKLVIPVALRK